MSTAHTPGPWEKWGSQVIHRVPNRAGAMVPCPVAHVTVVHKGNCPTSRAAYHEQQRRAEADARLMAAAPDHALIARLLCEGKLRWEPWGDEGRGELCFDGLRYATPLDAFGVPEMTQALRADIAKAEPS